jgi:DNA-binding NarL/FixJ family response regulator
MPRLSRIHLTAAASTGGNVIMVVGRLPALFALPAGLGDIAAAGLPSKVLILTTFDLDDYVYSVLRAGASGFLLKDTQPDDLVAAIRTVAAADAVLAPKATQRLIRQFAATPQPEPASSQLATQIRQGLTGREQDVFAHVAAGLSNGEIAAGLHLSPGTVKIHVGRILAKLGLRDRVQAVVLAYESGLITPGPTRTRAPAPADRHSFT